MRRRHLYHVVVIVLTLVFAGFSIADGYGGRWVLAVTEFAFAILMALHPVLSRHSASRR